MNYKALYILALLLILNLSVDSQCRTAITATNINISHGNPEQCDTVITGHKHCCMPNYIISENSRKIYNEILSAVNKQDSLYKTFINTALYLINTQYVAGTLENENENSNIVADKREGEKKFDKMENLIINLDKTDCILFVETSLAIAINIQNNNRSVDSLANTIKRLRYRDGVITDYTSRIHYTTEWALQASKNNILKDITQDLGGKEIADKISFMTQHKDLYKQLKNNDNNVSKIKQIEDMLNSGKYYCIPKLSVNSITNKLHNGDIVAFNTSTKGLDISHVGIIYRDKGRLTFIHASQSRGKVVIENKSLVEYINSIKSNNGIRVFRLNN